MEICVLSETLFQMFLMHWTESVYTVSLYSQCIEGMPHGLIWVACSIVDVRRLHIELSKAYTHIIHQPRTYLLAGF